MARREKIDWSKKKQIALIDCVCESDGEVLLVENLFFDFKIRI